MSDPCEEWQDLARSWRKADDRGDRWRQIVVKYTQCNQGVLEELQLYPDREHAERRADELIRTANAQGVEVRNEDFAQKVKDTADQLTAIAKRWEKPVARKPKRNVDRKADPVTMWSGELVYEVED